MGIIFKIILILFFLSLNISSVIADDSKVVIDDSKKVADKDKIKIYVLAESEDNDGIAKSIKVIIENISENEVAISEDAFTENAAGIITYNEVDGTTSGPSAYHTRSGKRKEDRKYIKIKPGELFGKKVNLPKEKYINISNAKDKNLTIKFIFYIDENRIFSTINSEFKF